ncbi:AMP-binding protein [Alphaproteobacteria bacterium]|nr:AMP-binding protein [Alphaproteobacteria bacterium]
MEKNIYNRNLEKCEANFQPLSPLSFLERAASAFPEKIAIIYGEKRFDYKTLYTRCKKLASSLSDLGIVKGDTVSIIAPNIPQMLEAHYGVPMTGAVLNSLNIRLDAKTLAFIIEHSEAKVLITDSEFSETIDKVLQILDRDIFVIDICDRNTKYRRTLGNIEYENFIDRGKDNFIWSTPEDEWDAISLNYTSGTTGNPKGVVCHHRGAYLAAIGNILAWSMPKNPVFLWTLPMFHCNGWTFTWAISINVGTHICLRNINSKDIYDAINKNKVTHLCGAPIIMNLIANDSENTINLDEKVSLATAAAPPPPEVIKNIEKKGFEVTHLYGLTETYGPQVVNDWDPNWDSLSAHEKAELKARQGIRYQSLEKLMVANPKDMKPVPADGKTLGEVFFKGNVIMKGYLKNEEATKNSFQNGWFHSGDLGVIHKNGYIELKDRSKDIIISGGENISTIEVENALYKHPSIIEAAVIAQKDEKWGESPCAFIKLKNNENISEKEIIEFCRQNLANFKIPKRVIFSDLPKTSTGKIQKFLLKKKLEEISD